jgi:hypothetical protein
MKIEDLQPYSAAETALLTEAYREGVRMANFAFLKRKYNLPQPIDLDIPDRILQDKAANLELSIAFAIRSAALSSGEEEVPKDFERAFLSGNRP